MPPFIKTHHSRSHKCAAKFFSFTPNMAPVSSLTRNEKYFSFLFYKNVNQTSSLKNYNKKKETFYFSLKFDFITMQTRERSDSTLQIRWWSNANKQESISIWPPHRIYLLNNAKRCKVSKSKTFPWHKS